MFSLIATGLLASGIIFAIYKVLGVILWYISVALCRLLDFCFEMFRVFCGVDPVQYQGKKAYLLDIFFGNTAIQKIYRMMMLIGIAMTFGFTIAAVIKKMFDNTGEKMKQSLGQILLGAAKAILLMLLLTAIVSASITATSILMNAIDQAFNEGYSEGGIREIDFDSTDYAAMFRALNTIANYGMNPSWDDMINLNACYNSIRNDLQELEAKGTFDFAYSDPRWTNGKECWQHILRNIAISADLTQEAPMDTNNPALSSAIKDAMIILRKNADVGPIKHYEEESGYLQGGTVLGRAILLSGSFYAANNPNYNGEKAYITDPIRGPFFRKELDIYNGSLADKYFDTSITGYNYIVVIIAAFFMVKEFAVIIINAVARIFNITMLYIVGPPFIAATPFDDGEKTKQWSIAFLIQSVGVIGSLVAVRLMIMFIPIIMDGRLIIFPTSSFSNQLAKVCLLIGAGLAAQNANSLITGILADQAGFQSMLAGDVGKGARNTVGSIGKKAFSLAGSAGLKATKGALKGIAAATGLTSKVDNLAKSIRGGFQSMKDNGGLRGASKADFKTSDQQKQEAKEAKENKRDADTASFRKQVLDSLNGGNKGGGNSGGGNSGGGNSGGHQSSAGKGAQSGSAAMDMSNSARTSAGGGGQAGGTNAGQGGANAGQGGADGAANKKAPDLSEFR